MEGRISNNAWIELVNAGSNGGQLLLLMWIAAHIKSWLDDRRAAAAMALGRTHWNWRPDVERIVQQVLSREPRLTANTYIDHPFPGWDNVSVDFWGNEGRGYPAPEEPCRRTIRYLMNLPGEPHIRHLIFEHRWWTSWSGWNVWSPNDHDGRLQHLHVTYWK